MAKDCNAVEDNQAEEGGANTKSKPERQEELVIRNHLIGKDYTLNSKQENAIIALQQFPTF